MKLWEYVRSHNLQDPTERRTVHCDAALKSIFNTDRLHFPQIPELTLSHILVADPIEIKYTIRADVPAHMSPEVYDITVNVDDPIRTKMSAVVPNPHLPNYSQYVENLRNIAALDDQTAVLAQAVMQSKMKRDFLMGIATDPAGFVKRWCASQKKDMETLLGEGEAVTEEEERQAMWKGKLGESVYMLLARQGMAPR